MPPDRESEAFAEEVRRFFEENHEGLERRRRSRGYYYTYLSRVLQARVAPGQSVLDVGCGTGSLLADLRPSRGVGVDLSRAAIAEAQARHAAGGLEFVAGDVMDPGVRARLGGPFDVITLVNVVTLLTDVQSTLEALHPVCHPKTRVLIYSYSRLWQPALRLAELLGMKLTNPSEAWLPPEEVENMLALADYEIVRRDRQILCPVGIPLLSGLINRWVGRLPVVDQLSLHWGLVARPAPHRSLGPRKRNPTVSVIIPCRNEEGHVAELARRLPALPEGSEFLWVEGNSKDGTEAAILDAIERHPDRPFRFLKQTGRGKGDAVRLGFAEARADIVAILDSDMGVAPEDLPRFVDALARGKGEMANGSRLVYPMEGRAMRFLNLIANKAFALLFTWLLGQQVRDTLCGTKVLWREDYERISANRSYFGDFDPFGDFDLLFGAARLDLRIVDLAVRYHERRYGETNISRFRHGLLLLRMSLFAARKLKFV
jgi:2-polyprenyl-3-methyl-5-hydroxy-6-metoxy-1,4-benzoquinol methylase